VIKDSPFYEDLDHFTDNSVADYYKPVAGQFLCHQEAQIGQATDNTFTFSFSGLPANTKLYYAVIAAHDDVNRLPRRIEIGSHSTHHFRTQCATNDKLVFGFSSCHDPFSTAQHGQHIMMCLTTEAQRSVSAVVIKYTLMLMIKRTCIQFGNGSVSIRIK